jgi:hypothetical protein
LYRYTVARDAMPCLSPPALRALEAAVAAAGAGGGDDEDAAAFFSLQDVAEAWVSLGEPLQHVAGLAAAAGRVRGHGGGEVDHVGGVAAALAGALDRLSRTFATGGGGGGGEGGTTDDVEGGGAGGGRSASQQHAAGALRLVITGTLSDDPSSGGRGKSSSSGALLASLESKDYSASLAAARGGAVLVRIQLTHGLESATFNP